MNPPRWEQFIRRGMRYMNIHLYAAQVYCNSWPHISDFIKVENSQVWRKFPGYGCEYQIIEIEAPWGLDCYDTKIIFRCCSYLTFERSRGWPFLIFCHIKLLQQNSNGSFSITLHIIADNKSSLRATRAHFPTFGDMTDKGIHQNIAYHNLIKEIKSSLKQP